MEAPSTDYKLRSVTWICIQHHAEQQEKYLLNGVDIDNYEVRDVQDRCRMLWAQFTRIAAAAAEDSTKKTATTNTTRVMNEGAEKEMNLREERRGVMAPQILGKEKSKEIQQACSMLGQAPTSSNKKRSSSTITKKRSTQTSGTFGYIIIEYCYVIIEYYYVCSYIS